MQTWARGQSLNAKQHDVDVPGKKDFDIDASEFILAIISEENLLTMPRMKLAFEILDSKQAKLIYLEKMRSIMLNTINRENVYCPISAE